jgi:formylmethanofuran dehydrogenase subunit C
MIFLLYKVKMIKDPKAETEEIPIPTDLKFDKRYAMKGFKICKIEDETEFREQAQVFLKEYFEVFQKGKDVEEFCSSADIEEIKGVLVSIKSKI